MGDGGVEKLVGRRRADAGEEDGLPIGLGLAGEIGGDAARGAGAVVDHQGLAQRCAQPFGRHPRQRVGAAAGGEGDDHPQGARGRPSLGRGSTRPGHAKGRAPSKTGPICGHCVSCLLCCGKGGAAAARFQGRGRVHKPPQSRPKKHRLPAAALCAMRDEHGDRP